MAEEYDKQKLLWKEFTKRCKSIGSTKGNTCVGYCKLYNIADPYCMAECPDVPEKYRDHMPTAEENIAEIAKYSNLMRVESSLMGSAWCVECYPNKEYSLFIYNGKSLCEKHFKEERGL